MKPQKTYVETMPQISSLYDRDFHAWANEQAALIRARRFDDIDLENIAEEIESMGRSEKREIASRLAVLLLHFLKWQHQPSHQSKSWQATIAEQRRRTLRHLGENSSLKATLQETLSEAYSDALADAVSETGLARTAFPEACPWTSDQIFGADWLPE